MKRIMNRITQNKVVRNASWLVGGKAVNMILAFFIGLLTARYLGPNNYGLINYATAYTTFFASLCTLGINSVIVKEFIDYPNEEGETIGTTLVLRCASSMLSALMICGISFIIDKKDPLTLIVVALCSISLIFQVFDTFNYWFQAHLQSKCSAIATTVAYIILSVYRIVLLVLGASVKWFALASSIDYFAVAIALIVFYKKLKGPKMSFSLAKAKRLLFYGGHFIIAGLMVSIYGSTDKLMLKQFLDETSVGYYSTALGLCNIWTFVLTAIIDSMYPIIMEERNSNYQKYLKRNRQLYAIVFYVSLAVSIVFSVAGPLIVKLLYGEAYLPAVSPLRVITWYVAFSYLGVARNAWMVSEHKQKYLVILYTGAAAINVILNVVLIPVWGTVGAAVASLITQISTVIGIPFFIKELRPNSKMMIQAVFLRDVF